MYKIFYNNMAILFKQNNVLLINPVNAKMINVKVYFLNTTCIYK